MEIHRNNSTLWLKTYIVVWSFHFVMFAYRSWFKENTFLLLFLQGFVFISGFLTLLNQSGRGAIYYVVAYCLTALTIIIVVLIFASIGPVLSVLKVFNSGVNLIKYMF